jgi:DNA-binding MarR family transcriptional regulator
MKREESVERIDWLLRRVMRGLHPPKSECADDLDITLGEMHCLREVHRLGEPAMGELAQRLYLQPSTATGLVDKLVAKGLLERREDENDRRVVRVAHTAEGRRRGEKHRRAHRARLLESLATLDDPELEQIAAALDRLQRAVSETHGEPEGKACREGGAT